MKTLALVESPAQLLNVVEWAHQTAADTSTLVTVVLAPGNELSRLQLRRTIELATAAGHTVRWHEPRSDAAASLRTVKALANELRGVERLVIGDPFSGVIQLVVGISRVDEVVMVDDGTATIEFARLYASGESLVRWHTATPSIHRRQIAAQARKRLALGSGCRLSLFTCMPVQLDGVPAQHNDFSWVRETFRAPEVKETGDLIGTSLVETGVVDLTHYLAGVQSLRQEHALDRYFAHRKEGTDKLARIEAMGLHVVRPDLPLELVARRDPIGRTIISFPSTVVYTLPLVLRDTSSRLLICDIADDWYTRRAPHHSDRFLGAVSASAREAHGLLSAAS
jgi:chloramphenicol 3-O-phosphotransferase